MPSRFRHQLLARARIELGLTQEQAAASVGIDVRTYRRYESGEVNGPSGFDVQRASRGKIVARMASELGLEESDLIEALVLQKPQPSPRAHLGHVLPKAAHFLGREAHLSRLAGWIADEASIVRVIALVGEGGTGKTSLIEQAVGSASSVFVWSFYEDDRVDAFLDSSLFFFEESEGGPGERLERLCAAILRAPRTLFVLDGLERVQASGNGEKARGEIDDGRLRLFLRRMARGLGTSCCLIATRAELHDLAGWRGSGYEKVELEPLPPASSGELLRRWGARGTTAELVSLSEGLGGHPLSVSMLGSYLKAFGGAGPLDQLDLHQAAKDDPLARKLSQLLDRYRESLTPLDRDVLGRICALSGGADLSTLSRIASAGAQIAGELRGKAASELGASVDRLIKRGLAVPAARGERITAHPFIRRHVRGLVEEIVAPLHELERVRLAELLPEEPGADASLDPYQQLFEHTLFAGRVEEAHRILAERIGGFADLGLRRGELARGLAMVRAFASAPHGSGGPGGIALQLDTRARWRLAYDWGLYSAALGELREAVAAYEASLAIVRDAGLMQPLVTTWRTLAYTHRLLGEHQIAERLIERSIAGARDAGIEEAVVRGVSLRGAILTSLGRLEEAGVAFAEVRAMGDRPIARRSLWEAEHLIALGELARARSLTEENLTACGELDWKGHSAHCHAVLGSIAVLEGDSTRARDHWRFAKDWSNASGEVEMALRTLLLEAEVLRLEGKKTLAREAQDRGRETAQLGGFRDFARSFESL